MHRVGLAYAPSNFQVPAAWYRPARDFAVEFTRARGRAPNAQEERIIADQVNEIRGGMTRSEELTFEHHHGVLDFFLKNGRMPSGYPARTGENQRLVSEATDRVNVHKDAYGAAHPSYFRALKSALKQDVSAAEKIPVVGDVVHIAGEAAAAPFKLAAAVASGERLDHALVGALKDQLKIIKDVAPYAESVVSLVPGLGTGIAIAIGAGAALAEGRSIDEAEKAAIKAAIPGGAVAAAAFDIATKVASGENVGKAALESARNLIPDGPARKAFDIGTAVATGQKIQTALANGLASIAPGQLQTVLAAGEHALATVPGLSDALKKVPIGEATQGFHLAAGLLSHSGLNEKSLIAVRNQLPPAVVQGFDAALKTQEPHLAWLKNVTSSPVRPTANAPAVASALRTIKPSAPVASVAKTPTPKKIAAAPSVPATKKTSPTKAPTMPTVPQKPAPTLVASHYAPYPSPVGISAPPHGGGGHGGGGHGGGHGGHGRPLIFRGGRGSPGWWWDGPWSPGVVTTTTTETCRTWGDPVEMPPSMQVSAKVALGASGGRPTTMRGEDGVLYLFSSEGGGITARPCTAVATGSLSDPPAGASWGPALTDMPRHMEWAGRSAVHGSRGRPRMVRGPDGADYLFAIEKGVLTARRAVAA